MRRAISNERFRQRVLARPQYRLLTDENDKLMMDYVGRYETLQESFDEICRQTGLTSSGLTRKNASRHRSYECYYDASLKESIAEYYRMDFELFGYDVQEIVADPLINPEYASDTP